MGLKDAFLVRVDSRRYVLPHILRTLYSEGDNSQYYGLEYPVFTKLCPALSTLTHTVGRLHICKDSAGPLCSPETCVLFHQSPFSLPQG